MKLKFVSLVMLLVVATFQFNIIDVKAVDTISKLQSDVVSASKSYEAESKKLNAIQLKYPAFTIQGEIIKYDKSGLYIWGIAVSDINYVASSSNPGWQINKGNIKIVNPTKSKINYLANIYADEVHYYVKSDYGTNSLGYRVPVKVYTKTAPASLSSQQRKTQAAFKLLQSKVTLYTNNVTSKYKKELSSIVNVDILKTNANEINKSYNLIKKYSDDNNLLNLLISYCNKIKEKAPEDLSNLYLMADIYSSINYSKGINDINEYIAKVSPDAYLKRMNIQKDINTIVSTLEKTGNPEYAIKALEIYIENNKNTDYKWNALDLYLNTLYSSGLKYKDKNDISNELKYLLKAKDIIDKYKLGEYSSEERKVVYKVYEELGNIYLKQEDYKSAGEYFDIVGTGDLNENTKRFENDSKFIELAQLAEKKSDLKTAFEYYDQLVSQYNRSGDNNQNVDFNMNSDDADSNFLLALAYLSHTRFNGEELDFGLKYLAKAYNLNPNNARINNALGYVYYQYYNKYPQKFTTLENTKLSEEEWTSKAIRYCMKAIELDPSYKLAYGNLYSIYSSDYNSGVRKAIAKINNIDLNINYGEEYYKFISNKKNELWDKSSHKSGIEQEKDL